MYGVASQPTSPKKSANVSLAENLLTEARRLQINISPAAEAGLACIDRLIAGERDAVA